MTAEAPVLQAERLSKSYRRRGGGREGSVTDAVDGVSLGLFRGQITALVGESGSGKSTTARMLLGLERPSSGRILLDGHDIGGKMTPGSVQMIFQDPFASLNPVHTVVHHIERALARHRQDVSRARRVDVALELLERVQLTPAAEIAQRRPHQLSGGQRQRVSIARALAAGPKVLLADEPVSMLDVSMRLGVLNLLRDLTRDEHLAMLYITHDIATARYFSDAILVMYQGRLVEGGPAEVVTQQSFHPYTRLLLESAPDPERLDVEFASHHRQPPAPVQSPRAMDDAVVITQCAFYAECPNVGRPRHGEVVAPLVADGMVDTKVHWAACSCSSRPDPHE